MVQLLVVTFTYLRLVSHYKSFSLALISHINTMSNVNNSNFYYKYRDTDGDVMMVVHCVRINLCMLMDDIHVHKYIKWFSFQLLTALALFHCPTKFVQ